MQQGERVELVFASQAEQQRAKQLLEQQGYDSSALTLEFYSTPLAGSASSAPPPSSSGWICAAAPSC